MKKVLAVGIIALQALTMTTGAHAASPTPAPTKAATPTKAPAPTKSPAVGPKASAFEAAMAQYSIDLKAWAAAMRVREAAIAKAQSDYKAALAAIPALPATTDAGYAAAKKAHGAATVAAMKAFDAAKAAYPAVPTKPVKPVK